LVVLVGAFPAQAAALLVELLFWAAVGAVQEAANPTPQLTAVVVLEDSLATLALTLQQAVQT
jgi:hypothetical protein